MSILNSVTSVFTPIHRDGWKFVAIFAAVTLVLFWLGLGFPWLDRRDRDRLVRLFLPRSRTRDAVARRPRDLARRWPRERHRTCRAAARTRTCRASR